MPTTIKITRAEAIRRAQIAHGGGPQDGSVHEGDDLVKDLLLQALAGTNQATRANRAANGRALDLWATEADDVLAGQVDAASKRERDNREKLAKSGKRNGLVDSFIKEGGINVADQYTGERVQNAKTEVLSRYVVGLIMPGTPILNNFFTTVRGTPAGTPSRLQEDVTYYEGLSDFSYYPVDPDRGELRSIEISLAQASHRVNHVDAMYGIMLEYEDYRNRVLPNASLGEIFSILAVGWAKASSRQRERDASRFLTDTIRPVTLFDNNETNKGVLGQTSGIGLNGKPNGTFNLDHDFPIMQDYMVSELGLDTSNMIMLLPRNAWSFLNRKKGYREFLGTDGQPLYQRPQITTPQANQTIFPENDYGIQYKGTGPRSAKAGAEYFMNSRAANGAMLQGRLAPGQYHFLPESVPNWGAEFVLPNSALGPMKVVLTPYEQAGHAVFPDGHPNANDPITGAKRPVLTTDILLFDGSRPLYLVETIPPTSWHATEELHRRSTVVMVEGWSLAATARGQQAVSLEGMVCDHDYRPGEFGLTVNLDPSEVGYSAKPLNTGLQRF